MTRPWWVAAAVAGAVFIVAAAPAASQLLVFDLSCMQQQQQGIHDQLGQLSADDRARHAEEITRLEGQAGTMMARGRAANDALVGAIGRAAPAARSEVAADPELATQRQAAARRIADLDAAAPTAGHELVSATETYDSHSTTAMMKRLVADPGVDVALARNVQTQSESNKQEVDIVMHRVEIGVSDDTRAKLSARSVDRAAAQSHLDAVVTAQLKDSPAWSQAAAALDVAQQIGRDGSVEHAMENLNFRAPFDTAGKAFTMARGYGLHSDMMIEQLGTTWSTGSPMVGSADAVDVRRSIGPETRKTIALAASQALVADGVANASRQAIRDSLRIVKSAPPPPANDAAPTRAAESFATTASAAVRSAGARVALIVRGAPIILPPGGTPAP